MKPISTAGPPAENTRHRTNSRGQAANSAGENSTTEESESDTEEESFIFNRDSDRMARLHIDIYDPTKMEASMWIRSFEAKAKWAKLTPEEEMLALPAHLQGAALLWHEALPQETRENKGLWRTAFLERFGHTPAASTKRQRDLFTLKQGNGQTVGEFALLVQNFCLGYEIPEQQQVAAILNGVDEAILPFLEVIPLNTVGAILSSSVAHRKPPAPSSGTDLLGAIRDTIREAIPPIQTREPRRETRKEGDSRGRQSRQCGRCGFFNCGGRNCVALNKNCRKCGGRNHFARVCRSK